MIYCVIDAEIYGCYDNSIHLEDGDRVVFKNLDHDAVLSLLPERPLDSHKGNYGKILLLCGSRGYTGAAALSAMGALRSGAGLVYLGVPESIYEIEAVKLLEPIVFPLPDINGHLSDDAHTDIQELLCDKNAVLIGPGLGRSAGTLRAVETALTQFSGPVVLDADGINVLQGHMDLLRGRTNPTILTPHTGEFKRIYDVESSDRIQSAVTFAQEFGVVLLLKGHHTVITDGNICYINQTGNPGMAVGGSGDLLAGILVGLLGQGLSSLDAAAAAAWIHGAAGDICASELGQYGMLPSDMLNIIPRLLK